MDSLIQRILIKRSLGHAETQDIGAHDAISQSRRRRHPHQSTSSIASGGGAKGTGKGNIIGPPNRNGTPAGGGVGLAGGVGVVVDGPAVGPGAGEGG